MTSGQSKVTSSVVTILNIDSSSTLCAERRNIPNSIGIHWRDQDNAHKSGRGARKTYWWLLECRRGSKFARLSGHDSRSSLYWTKNLPGYMWSRERLTTIQEITRPDYFVAWNLDQKVSKAAQKKQEQEHGLLKTQRLQRIVFVALVAIQFHLAGTSLPAWRALQLLCPLWFWCSPNCLWLRWLFCRRARFAFNTQQWRMGKFLQLEFGILAGDVCVSNDSSRGNGGRGKTTRLWWTSSWRLVGIHSGKDRRTPRLHRIPKPECPDIWIRLPRQAYVENVEPYVWCIQT